MKIKCVKSAQSLKSFFQVLYIVSILIFFSACIEEDLFDCNTFLHIKVINASAEDITSTGEAGAAVLYIFDRDQQFIEQRKVSAIDIQNKTPIKLPLYDSGNFWIAVWSNLNGRQEIDFLNKGITMQEALIRLKKDEQGYANNPDDLFYGIMNISSEKIDGESSINKDLVISRKTALVNIMVRGLSHSPNNKYHFVLRGAKRDAYDFKGSLTGNSIEYRQDGEFDSQNTLFISNLFTVFPLPDNDNLAIFIYQGEELIAIADTTQGKPIVPMVGVTNNILIDLTASLDVNIKITDWNTTYRWFEW